MALQGTLDRDFMAGLGKGLAVIECFDEQHQRRTIAEIAAAAGLSRAAARRCLLTLQRLGYAASDGKFFSLTPRVLRLGHAYLTSTELPQLVQPFLELVSEAISESCSASVLQGNEIVYIARSAKKRIMAVDLAVGSRLPAYCTSMGRIMLAALEPSEALRRLERTERRKMTPYTRTEIDDLGATLRDVRDKGYAVVDQELEIGLVSLAVPILNASGRTVAAINTGAQSARVPAAEIAERYLPRLIEAQASLRPLIKQASPLVF